MLRRFGLLLTALMMANVAEAAAEHLDVEWGSVGGTLIGAAERIGVKPVIRPMQCIGNYPGHCRWDAGDGVDVQAEDDGKGHLLRIDAGWRTVRAGAPATGAATFRSFCMTIAAMVEAKWTKAQVAQAVDATMVVKPSRKTAVEKQRRLPGVVLFGSRDTPEAAKDTFPGDAFLQCGAMTNFD